MAKFDLRSDACGLKEKEMVVGGLHTALSARLKIQVKLFLIKNYKTDTETRRVPPGGVLKLLLIRRAKGLRVAAWGPLRAGVRESV